MPGPRALSWGPACGGRKSPQPGGPTPLLGVSRLHGVRAAQPEGDLRDLRSPTCEAVKVTPGPQAAGVMEAGEVGTASVKCEEETAAGNTPRFFLGGHGQAGFQCKWKQNQEPRASWNSRALREGHYPASAPVLKRPDGDREGALGGQPGSGRGAAQAHRPQGRGWRGRATSWCRQGRGASCAVDTVARLWKDRRIQCEEETPRLLGAHRTSCSGPRGWGGGGGKSFSPGTKDHSVNWTRDVHPSKAAVESASQGPGGDNDSACT